jgi:type IV pilus assembly protein PilV
MEVMVSLVIISAGLLGVAKMQALALASTSVASMRSLAAIEAASLASAMHENRAYWSSTGPASNGTIAVAATTPNSTSPSITANSNLTGTVNCTSASPASGSTGTFPYCTPTQMAAYDLQQWALAVSAVLPNYNATINCTGVSPVSCTIAIQWTERSVALTSQEAQAQAAAAGAGTNYMQASKAYTLFVEP